MRYQFLPVRGFITIGLLCLLTACSQQKHTTKSQNNQHVTAPQTQQTETVQPEPVEPEIVEPKAVEPETIKPENAEPEPVAPEIVKLKPIEPEPVEPEVIEPKPVEPEPVEPEIVKLEPVEPEPKKPEVIEPKPVEPEPVEPEIVKLEPVEPEPEPSELVEPDNQHMTLSGQIQLNQDEIRRQNADVSKTVIYFQPDKALYKQLPVQTYAITTENKQFRPDVLAITRGSTVKFPVKDTILHNVFSVTPGSDFDLGLYSQGTAKDHVFEQSGIVYVHCNVHHSMQADVIVLETPYFTYADSDGRYQLTGLPQGSGQLSFWHPRGQQISTDISGMNHNIKLNKMLVITRPKIPKHNNKFGESYRPTRD